MLVLVIRETSTEPVKFSDDQEWFGSFIMIGINSVKQQDRIVKIT